MNTKLQSDASHAQTYRPVKRYFSWGSATLLCSSLIGFNSVFKGFIDCTLVTEN